MFRSSSLHHIHPSQSKDNFQQPHQNTHNPQCLVKTPFSTMDPNIPETVAKRSHIPLIPLRPTTVSSQFKRFKKPIQLISISKTSNSTAPFVASFFRPFVYSQVSTSIYTSSTKNAPSTRNEKNSPNPLTLQLRNLYPFTTSKRVAVTQWPCLVFGRKPVHPYTMAAQTQDTQLKVTANFAN